MTQTYKISGMTCDACVQHVRETLEKVEGVKSVEVDLSHEKAEVESDKAYSLDELKPYFKNSKYDILSADATIEKELSPLPSIGKKQINSSNQTEAKSWLATYKPLLLIFLFISLFSLIYELNASSMEWSRWMRNFMAGFFIVFSFFKFLNLKDFANSYSMYDIVARAIPSYGLIYPFIEFALGILYFINFNPVITNTATLIIMGVSTIGVAQSILDKRKIQCACLGAVFDLPMSKVTLIEDLIMVVMAVVMLIYQIL